MIPGKPINDIIPTKNKVFLIPREWHFPWQSTNSGGATLSPAELSAYNYFRQLGISTYFAEPSAPAQSTFALPTQSTPIKSAVYPSSYHLDLKQVSPNGQLQTIAPESVFSNFPARNGTKGLRCYPLGRIDPSVPPWDDASVVSELFWFEYTRYYFQISYLLSNNDLDMYVIGQSGSAYPVEIKSKNAAKSDALGEWFGIDVGPFAKLAFFTANAMNTDALYVVEEVDANGQFLNWLAIRYTELVKACSWVGQGGGKGMTGSASSTYKVPKAAFSKLANLLPTL